MLKQNVSYVTFDYARIFKYWRLKLDLKQKDFASLLGVSVNTISSIETGLFKPGSDLIFRLFLFLRLPVSLPVNYYFITYDGCSYDITHFSEFRKCDAIDFGRILLSRLSDFDRKHLKECYLSYDDQGETSVFDFLLNLDRD